MNVVSTSTQSRASAPLDGSSGKTERHARRAIPWVVFLLLWLAALGLLALGTSVVLAIGS